MEHQGCLVADLRGDVRRSGLRISDRRFHHCPGASARRRGEKRGSEDQAIGRSRGGLSTKIHMAVRGLGCPVRFTLTAGQKGDAPQAAALIEGLPAEVVMADTAYDADHCAKPSLPKARSPSSPTTRHGRSNIRSTSISMPSVISWSAASPSSSNFAASQPASKRPPKITLPSSLLQPSSCGCDKCPHYLGPRRISPALLDDRSERRS